MKFEHNGTEIELDEASGQFKASAGGKIVRKPSLKAMKDHLDRVVKLAFKPFSAIIHATYDLKPNVKGTDLTRVEVVAIEDNGRKGWRARKEFKVRKPSGNQTTVVSCYRDCQEAIEALVAVESYHKETQKIDEQRRKEAERLAAAANKFAVDPEAYIKKKADK